MGLFPQTPSCTNMCFVDSPDQLTGHRYLLYTLHVFVGKRCRTCLRDILLLSTYSSDHLSLSLLGSTFGVRYSDSQNLIRYYIGELAKKTRVMQARYQGYFGIDSRSIGNDKVENLLY